MTFLFSFSETILTFSEKLKMASEPRFRNLKIGFFNLLNFPISWEWWTSVTTGILSRPIALRYWRMLDSVSLRDKIASTSFTLFKALNWVSSLPIGKNGLCSMKKLSNSYRKPGSHRRTDLKSRLNSTYLSSPKIKWLGRFPFAWRDWSSCKL